MFLQPCERDYPTDSIVLAADWGRDTVLIGLGFSPTEREPLYADRSPFLKRVFNVHLHVITC